MHFPCESSNLRNLTVNNNIPVEIAQMTAGIDYSSNRGQKHILVGWMNTLECFKLKYKKCIRKTGQLNTKTIYLI